MAYESFLKVESCTVPNVSSSLRETFARIVKHRLAIVLIPTPHRQADLHTNKRLLRRPMTLRNKATELAE